MKPFTIKTTLQINPITSKRGLSVMGLTIVTLMVTTFNHAATPTNSKEQLNLIKQCMQITDDALRLACFDKSVVDARDTRLNTEQSKTIDLDKSVATSLATGTATVVLAQTNVDNATKQLPITGDAQTEQVLAAVGVTQADVEKYTPLSLLYDLDENNAGGLLTVRPHHPIYMLPLWYNNKANGVAQTPTQDKVVFDGIENIESKLQISFKTKLAQDLFKTRADLWFGYTQQAHWQMYNKAFSSPFRNTDYAPELFITQPAKATLPFDSTLRMLGAGVVHQSNGQSDPLSRSWNRAYIFAGIEHGKLTIVPRVWLRMPEKYADDNNPDITNYMGYGDLRIAYGLGENDSISGLLRYNPKHNKGSAQLDFIHPIVGGLSGYMQLYYGYGENLIDYNHLNRSIGFGVMLNDWTGL